MRNLFAMLAAGTAIATSAPVAAEPGGFPAPAPVVYLFDWPPQSLHDALQRYSQLTGDSMLYDSGQTAGKTAPPLVGRFTAREALTRLLAGTDLQAHYTAPQSVLLMPRALPRPAPVAPASQAVRQQYYGLLQSKVLAALCARPALRTGEYRVALRVALDGSHALSDVQVHATGKPEMEPALRGALSGLPIAPPPPGFDSPATLLITPEAARRYGGCVR